MSASVRPPPSAATLSPEARRRANAKRAALVVEACRAAGVRRFFIAPGSRSTPLVSALKHSGVPCHLVLDERSAGFAVVGAARVGVKAAVVTTSGTAVANLLPAACEADVDELPWVAVTADRPRAEVGIGANQTLDQPPLLASAARAVVDVPAPPEGDDAEIAAELVEALAALDGVGRGPVHINARFDKPLEPPVEAAAASELSPLPHHQEEPVALGELFESIAGAKAGVIVAGGLPVEARAGAERLVDAIGWPVVADITSGLRRGGRRGRELLPGLLRSASARRGLVPDVVLWLGGRMTDPEVAAWLGEHNSKVLQVKPYRGVRDPSQLVQAAWTCDLEVVAEHAERLFERGQGGTSRLHGLVEVLSGATLELPTDLVEPRVAATVAEHVRAPDVLLLGSSMPVRDVDRYSTKLTGCVVANRGASGIDGQVGTALGAALASGQAVTALIGDLTFLHDAAALVACAQARAPVRFVVVNNDGGGIFHFLPVAEHEAIFEPWFGTPHGVSVMALAKAYGVCTRRPETLAELEDLLRMPPTGPEVIEVVTERNANRALHRDLDAALERRVGIALEGQR